MRRTRWSAWAALVGACVRAYVRRAGRTTKGDAAGTHRFEVYRGKKKKESSVRINPVVMACQWPGVTPLLIIFVVQRGRKRENKKGGKESRLDCLVESGDPRFRRKKKKKVRAIEPDVEAYQTGPNVSLSMRIAAAAGDAGPLNMLSRR